jgi:peptide/nickel transport system substrate-binding protein
MKKTAALFAVLGSLALVAAGCGGSKSSSKGSAAGGDGGGSDGGTLVFASSADPVVIDGALVSDGESIRAINQIFETLVGLKPGTLELEPSLATSWKASNGGNTWTFKLRDGVKFQDGTTFDAKAVCANFDRWYNFTGSFQNPSATYYWQTVFGGFAKTDPKSGAPATSLYKSCEAKGTDTAVINLTHPSAAFLGALSLSAFAMASPTAMDKYGANEGRVDADGVFHPTGSFGTKHPIGTGPYKLESWTRGDKLVLVKNEDYWGDKAHLDKVIIRPIADNASRLQALQTGEIQGYDLVEPQDVKTIEGDSSLKVIDRPSFNVAYVGFNQALPPLDNPKVREAIAYGLDRKGVVDSFYAGRAQVANEFMPPSVPGYSHNVRTFNYDPAKAKALLKEAGQTLRVKIDFWYPTDVSRPYMPDPKRNFQAFQASLEKSGFKVVPHSAPWSPDYLGKADQGKAQVYLLGWTGDYGDPDNFVGTFFRSPQLAWGTKQKPNHAVEAALEAAVRITDQSKRDAAYEKANDMIMDWLPGVPYAHSKPALAFQQNVKGYVASPTSDEHFSSVSIEGK